MTKTSPAQNKGMLYSPCVLLNCGPDEHECHEKRLLQEYKFATDQTNTISIISLEGFFIYVNDKHCNASGYNKSEIIGKHYSTIVHPDMSEEAMNNILNTLQVQKIPWKGMIKNKAKDGGFYWLKTKIIPIFDTSGEVIEYISVGNDITERYLAEEDLRKSFMKLQKLDEKKDEFINIASHELRTPMTAISGYISMILDGDAGEISAESRVYLEQVYKSSKQLITLINDMLDIAKLESGKGKLCYEDIEMHAFMSEVLENLKPLALLKKQEMEVTIDFESLVYRTDVRKFQQVLMNIIGNALKYTQEKGKIIIHSWVTESHLYIQVTDTGIGIPEKNLVTIFEKFSQVKNPLTRDVSGTGLGLAITKKIVEKFFGTIDVKSEEGKGSVFTVELPLQID